MPIYTKLGSTHFRLPPLAISKLLVNYSGTTPPRQYGHLVNRATLSWSEQNFLSVVIFLFNEPLRYGHPVNTASFLWSCGERMDEVPL